MLKHDTSKDKKARDIPRPLLRLQYGNTIFLYYVPDFMPALKLNISILTIALNLVGAGGLEPTNQRVKSPLLCQLSYTPINRN